MEGGQLCFETQVPGCVPSNVTSSASAVSVLVKGATEVTSVTVTKSVMRNKRTA
jgi:hypothetical protein